MAPSCCLIFNLHYVGETQESVVFSCFFLFLIQKKATATKGGIKDGVFTCLIRKNCNWKSKGVVWNASERRAGERLFRNLKVILSEGAACKSETYLRSSHLRFTVREIRLANKWHQNYGFQFFSCCLVLGALERSYCFKRIKSKKLLPCSRIGWLESWPKRATVLFFPDWKKYGQTLPIDRCSKGLTEEPLCCETEKPWNKIERVLSRDTGLFPFFLKGDKVSLNKTMKPQPLSRGTVPKLTPHTDLLMESSKHT